MKKLSRNLEFSCVEVKYKFAKKFILVCEKISKQKAISINWISCDGVHPHPHPNPTPSSTQLSLVNVLFIKSKV